MRRSLALITAFALFIFAGTAAAAPVFTEDFEDGAADNWAPSGGDTRLTQYAGNTSLRLSGSAAVVGATSTNGFTDVTIAAAMAARSLEAGEYCLVEASADGGRTWLQIVRVGDGQDDGVTLHTASVRDARLDNAPRLLIGARVSGNADDDQCWLDNVRVVGITPQIVGARAALSRDVLMSGAMAADLSPMAAFAPSADASPHTHFSRAAKLRSQRFRLPDVSRHVQL
ncbi:MAG: hypothetical protein M0D54_20940 [Hyphomonadaceae bacterium JAD_PAG50586_4]|nr:MAG: hypothetical protein M0D54_20940 [Hyphomonadaceae bacterium JAD_PAG50586_4]